MIIDAHAHTITPQAWSRYQSLLLNSRGSHGPGGFRVSDDEILATLTNPVFGGGSLIDQMAEVGTDLQLISPRPISMSHHEKPESIVHWYIAALNDVIGRQAKLRPDKFRGVAGLPQNAGVSPANSVEELERCVKELGMVGCVLNPDPSEGFSEPPPGLGDEYWYPLYETLVELDVPALVHSTQCGRPREPYTLHFINEESIAIISLLQSRVFIDFPTLKLVISHGGGSIPYQIGRFRSFYLRPQRRVLDEPFEQSLRRLYFDTCLYSKEALELLFKVVGPDRCLFGAERPGTGSEKDPDTGRWFDDIKPLIDDIDALTDADRQLIYEDNAKKLHNLDLP